jgi:hypothetical protein
MIAAIVTTQQFARTQKNGPYAGQQVHLQEFDIDERRSTSYAHSSADALAWLRTFPSYADVQVEDLGDGRLMLRTAWMPDELQSLLLGETEPTRSMLAAHVTHTRLQVIIHPVGTIYETTTLQAYRKPQD